MLTTEDKEWIAQFVTEALTKGFAQEREWIREFVTDGRRQDRAWTEQLVTEKIDELAAMVAEGFNDTPTKAEFEELKRFVGYRPVPSVG